MKSGSYGLRHTLRQLGCGQSLLRIRMNVGFSRYTLRGNVLDIGGGRNPDYFSYFKQEPGVSIIVLDGSLSGIDFEQDTLPLEDASVDTVVLANVLEHIYNHQFLLSETRRVLAPSGQLIGFVPFWNGYHPDPHDYFRYTHEALERLASDAGFTQVSVTPLPGGPFAANFNTIVLSLPRLIRPLAYLWYALLDSIFIRLRPASQHRYPLGYLFHATSG